MSFYYYFFYFPSWKKVRRERRCGGSFEDCDLSDCAETASTISTITVSDNDPGSDSSSDDELWYRPRLNPKMSATASAARREIIVSLRIIRRQERVLEEMRLRTIQIREATEQRRQELAELRAARARREAAAAANMAAVQSEEPGQDVEPPKEAEEAAPVADMAAAMAEEPEQQVETSTETEEAQRLQEATTETDGKEDLKDAEFDNNKK